MIFKINFRIQSFVKWCPHFRNTADIDFVCNFDDNIFWKSKSALKLSAILLRDLDHTLFLWCFYVVRNSGIWNGTNKKMMQVIKLFFASNRKWELWNFCVQHSRPNHQTSYEIFDQISTVGVKRWRPRLPFSLWISIFIYSWGFVRWFGIINPRTTQDMCKVYCASRQ